MIRLHTLPLALITLAALGAAGCSSNSGTPEKDVSNDGGPTADSAAPGSTNLVSSSEKRAAPVAADLATAVDANNAFAIDLYGKAAPSASGGNFLTSPISATLALTMTYAGAQGTTATQMASVLHIPSSGPSIFDAQNALSQALNGRAAAALAIAKQDASGNDQPAPSASDYELQVVNSVWGQKGYPWDAPFLDILAASYGTGVYVEDFETDAAAGEAAINQWVSSATSGKISPLLPPNTLDQDTRMVLVNAIHVKLPWASPFQKASTKPGSFTRGDGTTVQPSFMSQEYDSDSGTTVGYADTTDAQIVTVPLAGGDLTVAFALPKADLATFTASLTKDTFAAATPAADVIFNVPKFTLTSDTFSLATPLQALGMTDAFDSVKADFKGICTKTPDGQNLFISDVLQKATLDVAENGVEAAAATAVIISTGSVSNPNPPTPITVTLDHPFVVSILDSSGAILFLGQINDPTSSGT